MKDCPRVFYRQRRPVGLLAHGRHRGPSADQRSARATKPARPASRRPMATKPRLFPRPTRANDGHAPRERLISNLRGFLLSATRKRPAQIFRHAFAHRPTPWIAANSYAGASLGVVSSTRAESVNPFYHAGGTRLESASSAAPGVQRDSGGGRRPLDLARAAGRRDAAIWSRDPIR